MTRQATLYISNHTERLAQEIAEHRGLPAERYRTRLYEALVSEEHSRIQAQEAEMTKRRMGTAEIRGEALYDAATNMSIAEALVTELKTVLGPLLCGLGEGNPPDTDDPARLLRFAASQLSNYVLDIHEVLRRVEHPICAEDEADDDANTH